jgi:alpha-ribazole phosphatase
MLYLVRHGRTVGAEGRCIGRTDLELAPSARDGLHRLALSFPSPPAALYTSDLARCRQTADVLASAWGAEPIADRRLREVDFGEWDGRSWDELQASDGDRLATWMDAWVETGPPGGESFRAVAERTAAWLAELRDGQRDGDIVVVAHAGSIRGLLCNLLGWPLERAFQLGLDHGRVSAVRLDAEPALVLLNADRIPAAASSIAG